MRPSLAIAILLGFGSTVALASGAPARPETKAVVVPSPPPPFLHIDGHSPGGTPQTGRRVPVVEYLAARRVQFPGRQVALPIFPVHPRDRLDGYPAEGERKIFYEGLSAPPTED